MIKMIKITRENVKQIYKRDNPSVPEPLSHYGIPLFKK